MKGREEEEKTGRLLPMKFCNQTTFEIYFIMTLNKRLIEPTKDGILSIQQSTEV